MEQHSQRGQVVPTQGSLQVLTSRSHVSAQPWHLQTLWGSACALHQLLPRNQELVASGLVPCFSWCLEELWSDVESEQNQN